MRGYLQSLIAVRVGSCDKSPRPESHKKARTGGCDYSPRTESPDEVRAGSCDKPPRPESHKKARTGSCTHTPRPESTGETLTGSCDQLPRLESSNAVRMGSCDNKPHPDSFIHPGIYTRATTSKAKSAYYALRLKHLHEEHAIQQIATTERIMLMFTELSMLGYKCIELGNLWSIDDGNKDRLPSERLKIFKLARDSCNFNRHGSNTFAITILQKIEVMTVRKITQLKQSTGHH